MVNCRVSSTIAFENLLWFELWLTSVWLVRRWSARMLSATVYVRILFHCFEIRYIDWATDSCRS